MQETQLLLADDAADINITNPCLEYIWQFGRHDLFDGMLLADKVGLGGLGEGSVFSQTLLAPSTACCWQFGRHNLFDGMLLADKVSSGPGCSVLLLHKQITACPFGMLLADKVRLRSCG
jgi:hypothetical protein